MIENIKNYDIYLTKMSKTFFDKAWFMTHLPEEVKYIIDFGCADGSFMKFLQINCPSYTYIGIDNDPKFKKMTEEKGFKCYSSLFEIDPNIRNNESSKCCVILNSVIHEIYSYNHEADFFKQLDIFNPKYIAIRDMMYNPIDRSRFYLPIRDFKKIESLFNEKYSKQWKEFDEIWNTKQDFETKITHFLLKYIYNNENWFREVKENYLPIDIKEIRKKFNYKYDVDFQSFYKLPYLVNKWKEDFELNKNFELNEFIRNINTHYKMLLKRGDD